MQMAKKKKDKNITRFREMDLWETKHELKKTVNEKVKFYEHLAKEKVDSLVKMAPINNSPCHVGVGEAISETSY